MNSTYERRPTLSFPHSSCQPVSQPCDILTVSEAARLLRVSRRGLERLASRGSLPSFALPIRGGLRFDQAALVRWLASRHREGLGTK